MQGGTKDFQDELHRHVEDPDLLSSLLLEPLWMARMATQTRVTEAMSAVPKDMRVR